MKCDHVGEACNNFQTLMFVNEGLDAAENLLRRTSFARYFTLSQRKFPDFLKLYFWQEETLFGHRSKEFATIMLLQAQTKATQRVLRCGRSSVQKKNKN